MEAKEIFSALLTPEGRADPYPLYSALHELGPAAAAEGIVLVGGYEEIGAILRDPAFRVADAARLDEIMPAWRDHPSLSAESLLTLNPPDHARIRSLVSKAFTPRRVAALEPAVAGMTDRLLDEMAETGADGSPVQFMHDFAFLLPVTVICELLGIPEQDRERFRPLATALVATLEPIVSREQLAAADEAAVELNDYFAALAQERRGEPHDDLISALVAVSDSRDGRLTDSELIDNLVLLLAAGFETTANLLGNGLNLILTEPGTGAAIRDGSLPVASFVEEVLRFDSPVQATSRRRPDPVQIAGVRIAPFDEVITLFGAGNRDPRRFAEPNKFDPARSDGGPLSFGGGAHYCLGAALARLEAGVAFPRLLARFPDISAAGPPERKDSLVLRGFQSLPVYVS